MSEQKKVLILCNGEPPQNREWLQSQIALHDLFICADGGGNVALGMGFYPYAIVGDLDSLAIKPEEKISIILDHEQNSTDAEKAIRYALGKEATEITLIGALGSRMDQTLNNLYLLKKFKSRVKIKIRNEQQEIFLIENGFQWTGSIGQRISLIPLSDKVEQITTDGLKYALQSEPLEIGGRDGISNVVESNPVSIHFKSGDLLLVINY